MSGKLGALDLVPQDVLLEVLKFLDAKALRAFERVCKHAQKLTQLEIFDKTLFERCVVSNPSFFTRKDALFERRVKIIHNIFFKFSPDEKITTGEMDQLIKLLPDDVEIKFDFSLIEKVVYFIEDDIGDIISNCNSSFLFVANMIRSQEGSKDRYLLFAVAASHISLALAFVAMGANKDAVGEDGATPLLWACFLGDLKLVKRLLLMEVNVNCASMLRMTPLMIASYYGHKDIVELLLKYDINVNAEDTQKATALDYALQQKERDEIIVLLRKNGAVG